MLRSKSPQLREVYHETYMVFNTKKYYISLMVIFKVDVVSVACHEPKGQPQVAGHRH